MENQNSKFANFVSLNIFSKVLLGLGQVMSPFSKISNTPVIPKSEFAWANLLEENWEGIQSELLKLLENDQALPNIQDIQPAEAQLNTENKWKTFFLFGFGIKAKKNCEKCPITTQVLEQIPGMITGFFSILYPGMHIPAHRGIFKGIVRTHLGLLVPGKPGDSRMRVGKEIIKWENGKAVFFDDTYNHEVWNESNGIRVVLLIDTIRPYESPFSKLNESIINGVTASVYVKDAFKKNEEWEKTYHSIFP
jgi:aspartyl/asparaginyl beta-hydroxylase (cupin superfamily)